MKTVISFIGSIASLGCFWINPSCAQLSIQMDAGRCIALQMSELVPQHSFEQDPSFYTDAPGNGFLYGVRLNYQVVKHAGIALRADKFVGAKRVGHYSSDDDLSTVLGDFIAILGGSYTGVSSFKQTWQSQTHGYLISPEIFASTGNQFASMYVAVGMVIPMNVTNRLKTSEESGNPQTSNLHTESVQQTKFNMGADVAIGTNYVLYKNLGLSIEASAKLLKVPFTSSEIVDFKYTDSNGTTITRDDLSFGQTNAFYRKQYPTSTNLTYPSVLRQTDASLNSLALRIGLVYNIQLR